jgi:putative membrane protein
MLQHVGIYLRGVAMGAADVVPGVSGGTIAFITGIYEKLLDSIKSFDLQALQFAAKFNIRALWGHINGTFLVALFAGIATSIISLAKLITYLMEFHPVPLWSFFCGLIVISTILVLKEIKKWDLLSGIALLFGTIAAYAITTLTPSATPEAYWFIFLSGAIAICAMILPGISGSFLLLVMGKYEFILNSVKELNIAVIIVFAMGCAFGLLSFSRVVSWLLKHYHSITVAALAGFMIGSINKIWPWKEVVEYRLNSKGVQKPFITQNLLPNEYAEVVGSDPQIILAVIFFVVGIVVIYLIDRLTGTISKN